MYREAGMLTCVDRMFVGSTGNGPRCNFIFLVLNPMANALLLQASSCDVLLQAAKFAAEDEVSVIVCDLLQ